MLKCIVDLWHVFLDACMETPKGMMEPFIAFWRALLHNPMLHKSNLEKPYQGEK